MDIFPPLLPKVPVLGKREGRGGSWVELILW